MKRNFAGLRVVAFESREAEKMRRLIEEQDGIATVVSTMQLVPFGPNPHSRKFEMALRAGQLDITIWNTELGVGLLSAYLDTRLARADWFESIRRTLLIARSPGTAVSLREIGLECSLVAPSPHTWRETLQATIAAATRAFGEGGLSGRQIAVQESGSSNRLFLKELQSRGARVLRVPVYRWTIPDDSAALQLVLEGIVENRFDVALFTAAPQVWHLFKLAYRKNMEDELRAAMSRLVVASIGPATTEALLEFETPITLEAATATMESLVRETAEHLSVSQRFL